MAIKRAPFKQKTLLLITALGVVVLIWGVLLQAAMSLQNERESSNRKELIQDASRAQALLQEVLFKEYEQALSDLNLIASQVSKYKYLDAQNSSRPKEIEAFLMDLGLTRGNYYQVRILDTAGNERCKIQFDNQLIEVNANNQNKRHREYFKEAKKLNAGEIYISKMDLNVERNEITRPFVPVIRFITPVVAPNTSRILGYAVLNFNGKVLLGETKNIEQNTALKFHILNKDGFWLAGPNQADNWAFLFAEPEKHHVSSTWPSLASAIERRSSLLSDASGLSSIAYLNLPEMLVSYGDKLHGDLPEWRVIANYPTSYLKNRLQEETILGWGQTVLLGLVSTLIIVVVFFYLLRKDAKLQLVQMELKERNHSLRQNELILQENLAQMEELTQEREKSIDRLQEKERELSLAKRNAEHATQVKSDFLATMSHEIRTPLNAVLGMSQLLERTALSPDQLDLLKTLKLSGESLLGLINEILDFSKIESENLELENQDFFIDQVCEEAIELISSKANEKEIGLSYTIDKEVPFIYHGDVSRLRQILINLLSNAIKFTDKGRVELRVFAANRQLHLEVMDTGIGIPKEKLATVFEAFKQADSSVNRKFGGTGLGLAISKKLALAMGGDIDVSSSLGIGSSFKLMLPLEDKQNELPPDLSVDTAIPWYIITDNFLLNNQVKAFGARFSIPIKCIKNTSEIDAKGILLFTQFPEQHPNRAIKQIWISHISEQSASEKETNVVRHNLPFRPLAMLAQLHPESIVADNDLSISDIKDLSILVAEDNPVNQKLIKLVLDQLSLEPQIVSNGLEAVQAARSRNFDVILMDIQMPEMDGMEATKHIRNLPGDHRPYIVAVTANAFSNQKEEYLVAGMNAHLSKPYKISEVEAMLHEASKISHSIS